MPARTNLWVSLLIGVSCLLIGFAASTLAYRYRYLQVPNARIIDRMDHDLNLTPAERQQISQIMHDTRNKAFQMRQQMQHQRHLLFADSFGRVRAVLTPEQQKKFDRDFPLPPWARDDRGGDHHEPGDHGPPPEP